MEWWERVRDLVEERSIRQVDLAAKLNVQQGSVSNVINGRSKNARHKTIEAYASALGVSVQWLTTGREEPSAFDLEPQDVFVTGREVFKQWVEKKDAEHLHELPAFFDWADSNRDRWSFHTTAFEVTEDLMKHFRKWRRGEFDAPEGVPFRR